MEWALGVQVQEFEMLLEPPPSGTFEMNWPPYTLVRDLTAGEGSPEPMYSADINGQLKRIQELAVGDPLPRIDGTTWFEQSSTVDLANLGGKHLLIYLWATWCGPCMAGLPKIEKVFEEIRDEPNVIIMGLNPYDEGPKLDRFMREKGLTFPQLLGEDARAAMRAIGWDGAGGGLLMGPEGRIIEMYSSDRLTEVLAQLPRR